MATMRYIKECNFCGGVIDFRVPISGYWKWRGGMAVQDAFPELDATHRECFISGLCESCQAKVFGTEDDD